jgi:phosphoglycerate dehydrogenase-like enzyme
LIEHPRRDYQLTGLRGIFGQAMTEYVLGWLLALERGVIRRAQAQHWDATVETGVADRRVGILGTGDIARAVARGCGALGMKPSGLNSSGSPVEAFDTCFAVADRLAFAEGLDYLVALLPETPGTNDLVDRTLLDRLSSGAIFINAGRANSVVDADLLDALADGRLRAAVLDVTRREPLPSEHPFWTVEGLFLTSHTAAPTSTGAVIEVFAENYRRYLAGSPLLHLVDFERGY